MQKLLKKEFIHIDYSRLNFYLLLLITVFAVIVTIVILFYTAFVNGTFVQWHFASKRIQIN